ncbi:MAG: ATP-binding protein [Clostridia bacterium]|nr:ATP-binding protein [Clostridia bacterium]
MKNFEKMIAAIELSKNSKTPMLIVGNPGYGKTTVVNAWAIQNGYHVEEIMGSSFSRDEVLGYMVNVNGSLEMLEPFWFKRIKKLSEEGKPSVLFIDELSTTGTDVQSSLLRLIFERTIGSGEKLPEDTIIISAANYKANLPGYCDVSSPTLNRFCIINITESDVSTLVDDYVVNEMPTPQKISFKDVKNENYVRSLIGEILKKAFMKYESPSSYEESGQKAINLMNHDYQIYDSENDTNSKKLLNFISGRSVNYLMKVVTSIAKSSLNEDGVSTMVKAAVEGLIGAGTNNFASEDIQNAYIAFTSDNLIDAVKNIRENALKMPTAEYVPVNKEVKPAVTKSLDETFEQVRRDVEFNPEKTEEIKENVAFLFKNLEVKGRNFEKRYNDNPLFASFCIWMTQVFDDYQKKYKLGMRDCSYYIQYYLEKMNKEAA